MSDHARQNAADARGVGEGTSLAVREIAVTLSAEQVQAVVQVATAPAAVGHAFASALGDPNALASSLRPLLDDLSYSRSVLRALLILAGFPADGTERELTAVADEVGFSTSTTHRYLHTWEAAGLLERDADSRRYRRPKLSATG